LFLKCGLSLLLLLSMFTCNEQVKDKTQFERGKDTSAEYLFEFTHIRIIAFLYLQVTISLTFDQALSI